MNKNLEQIEQELDEKIPRDVVSLRDGGGGRKLSYLEGFYVIDRLNKIFGPFGWAKEILDVREVRNTTGKGEFPAYLVKVRLTVKFGSEITIKDAYGYGSDKSSQNAHELAIKEGVTDALKVAAKDLGMSMGLALYDKTQENVDDGDPEPYVKPVDPVAVVVPGSAKPVPSVTIEEQVRSYFKVAEAQKRLTKDSFRDLLHKDFGAEKLAELDHTDKEKLLVTLKGITK